MSGNGLASSFAHALAGVRVLFSTQRNARIHLLALALVAVAGLVLRIGSGDWALVALASALVLASEAMNSALEFLSDHVAPERHDLVRKAKDLAAASVLLASLGAMAVGALVFLPRIL